jgi:uncharacterized protein YrrD
MRAELGTNVRSRDDKPLGSIEWVLVDPDTRMAKSIGVRHGIIREHAVKIPLHEVHPAKSLDHLVAEVDEASTRHLTKATVHAEDAFPDGEAVAASTSGGVFPADAFVTKRREAGVTLPHSELSDMVHMVDADVVVLGDGSDVYTKNMHHIGELEQIRFEAHTGQLLSIVIKRGVLHHQEFELPGELIGGVDEGSIYLNVDRDEVREHILKNR